EAGLAPMLDVKEAQRWIVALRDMPKRGPDARKIEIELEKNLPSALAQKYRDAVKQYAQDSRVVDTIRDFQKEFEFPGGVSAAADPEWARASRRLGLGPGREALTGSEAAHAAAAALVPSPTAKGYHGLRAFANRLLGESYDPLTAATGKDTSTFR